MGPIVWKHDVIHKTGSTQRIATPSQDHRATDSGPRASYLENLVQFYWADRQTDRQTDILITILRTCIDGEVKTNNFTVWRKTTGRFELTRSSAVAGMADHTAPIVKLTLTLNLTGDNLAKQALPLKGAHYEAKWGISSHFLHFKNYFRFCISTSGCN